MLGRMEILTALGQFARGVLRRAYFWLFALLLDPFDLYGRFKPSGWPAVTVPTWLFWVVLALLVFWSAFMTSFDLWLRNRNIAPHANRNVGASEAIAYICFREWGKTFFDAANTKDNKASNALNEFLQAASDGDVKYGEQILEVGHLCK